ncbi:MAG: hypothetical protein P9L98_04920 [Candidatus Kaelpia imicola]|nr:hypothetical protein [Candidatus Kaelpia imicola]
MTKKILLFILILIPSVYAQDFALVCNGDYFTIHCHEGVDPLDIAYKIKVGPNFYIYKDSDKQIFRGGSPSDILAENIDALFEETSDLLDMHLYSYHGDIKIFLTKDELKRVFFELLGGELKSESFYYHDENTVYISAESLRAGMLAHEIAHAIISHYFVVLPPVKVQEVLSGYVEYNINKKLSE